VRLEVGTPHGNGPPKKQREQHGAADLLEQNVGEARFRACEHGCVDGTGR